MNQSRQDKKILNREKLYKTEVKVIAVNIFLMHWLFESSMSWYTTVLKMINKTIFSESSNQPKSSAGPDVLEQLTIFGKTFISFCAIFCVIWLIKIIDYISPSFHYALPYYNNISFNCINTQHFCPQVSIIFINKTKGVSDWY